MAQKESEFIQKMMNFTGSNLTFQHEYQLLDYILMSREGDLPLPEWVTDEVYNHVDDVNIKINQALLGSQKLLRLRGGPFLKEFSERLGKIASKGPNEKFFGYSAHDHSLANLFRVMNVLVKRWPPVGSAMLFELHRREENEYFVKVRKNLYYFFWHSVLLIFSLLLLIVFRFCSEMEPRILSKRLEYHNVMEIVICRHSWLS